MPRIDLHEGEAIEFKRRWTDQALEDLAAFANTRGGTLLVGVQDDGDVVGVADPEAEIQRIANTVASRLGLTPSVSRRSIGGREVIEVRVEPARGIVGLNGRYRTGWEHQPRSFSGGARQARPSTLWAELGWTAERLGTGSGDRLRPPPVHRRSQEATP